MAARPRGGDWLEDEITGWSKSGISMVLSLLTPQEEQELDLTREAEFVREHGMKFVSFPVPDRQVPNSESEMTAVLESIDAELAAGKNVLVHCRQGIGRTGLVGSCLLIIKGLNPEKAVQTLTAARGTPVPETDEQRHWIEHYAAVLAGHK